MQIEFVLAVLFAKHYAASAQAADAAQGPLSRRLTNRVVAVTAEASQPVPPRYWAWKRRLEGASVSAPPPPVVPNLPPRGCTA